MGSCYSAAFPPKESIAKTKFVKTSTTNSNFGRPSNLERQDYIIQGKKDTFILKNAINGQQFCVEDTVDSSIFLCDHIAQLTVDSCHNVVLITGPVEGSIFLRDCNDCTFVIACQQLRLRNCKNCKILLFSTTGPIVESCTNIGFGCYTLNYFDLRTHFESAGLHVMGNSWLAVFDFTATADSKQAAATNSNEHYYSLPCSCDHGPGPRGLDIGGRLSADERAALLTQGYSFLSGYAPGQPPQDGPPLVPLTHGLLSGLKHSILTFDDIESFRRHGLVVVPMDRSEDLLRRLHACPLLYTGRHRVASNVTAAISSRTNNSSSSSRGLGSNSKRAVLGEEVASTDGQLVLLRSCILKGISPDQVHTLLTSIMSTAANQPSESWSKATTKFMTAKAKERPSSLSLVAVELLLPTSGASIPELLRLSDTPSASASADSAATSCEHYFWCDNCDATSKAQLLFEQWAEKT